MPNFKIFTFFNPAYYIEIYLSFLVEIDPVIFFKKQFFLKKFLFLFFIYFSFKTIMFQMSFNISYFFSHFRIVFSSPPPPQPKKKNWKNT